MRSPSPVRRTVTRALAPIVAAALLAGTPFPAAAGTPADALVDRVLAAYGGKAALARVKGYRMEGSVTSVMRGTEPLVRTFARPDRLRIALEYPGHPETRIFDRDRGWRSDGTGKMSAADGFLLTSMALQAARSDLPWILDERRGQLAVLPPTDDGTFQGLEFPIGPGLTVTAYVESATGRIVRSAAVLTDPKLQTNFATEYSDFRRVDGILFPFREANFASNQSTGDTVITKIVLNPPLGDADFRP